MNRKDSKKSLGSAQRSIGPKSDRSKSNNSDNSAKYHEPRKNLMSTALNSKFVLNTRTINKDDTPTQ